MPITFAPSNEIGERIIKEQIQRFRKDRPFRSMHTEDILLSHPHRWYGVGLADLIEGKLLSRAESAVLRYVFLYESRPAGIGTLLLISKEGESEDPQFDGLWETCFSKETLQAIEFAEKLPEVISGSFELRFLSAMAVYFFAIWLHSESEDIVIPLPPTYGRMSEYQVLSESQILEGLKADIEGARDFGNKLTETCDTAKELRRKANEKRSK